MEIWKQSKNKHIECFHLELPLNLKEKAEDQVKRIVEPYDLVFFRFFPLNLKDKAKEQVSETTIQIDTYPAPSFWTFIAR